MFHSARTTLLAIVIVAACVRTAAGQPAAAVVRGQVVDGSGGVLPGVTVIATGPNERVLATTVTDEVGQYVFAGLPDGRATLSFQIEGFDTASADVTVRRGAETWIVERLKLAQVAEAVIVYGKAPADRAVLPAFERRPAPVVIPVPQAEMESICLPAKPGSAPESVGTIESHRYDPGRTLYAKGDELNIAGGLAGGLEIGRNLVVRRHYRTNTALPDLMGEHTAGLVQIVWADERTAYAVVVHVCSELMQGDFLASFRPEPLRTPDAVGTPAYDAAIRILFADAGQLLGAARRLMVIAQGSDEGLHIGQRLTLFRATPAGGTEPFVLGEAVVVSVRADSATIRIERAIDAIGVGDWAAPQRPVSDAPQPH